MPSLYKMSFGKTLGEPDIGQVYYLVDSDYRTVAQGWSKLDGTGPLDLWQEKHPGQVFYCGAGSALAGSNVYATDSLGIQAGIDSMVDYRGDSLYFTPGSYAPATALVQDVHDSRWMGSPVSHPVSARATITAGVAACVGVSAINRFEMCYLVWLPLTASHIFAVADGAAYLHFHDFKYSTIGIAANTATQFILAAGTMNNSVFENFYLLTDAGQGPMIELDGSVTGLILKNFEHMHTVGTLDISLLDVDGAGSTCITVGPGHGQIGGAAGVVTTLVDHANMTVDTTNITIKEFTGSLGYCTNATLIPAAGAAAEADYISNWLAATGGGAGRTAYIGTS